jgi:hypothetical protein
LRIKYSLEKCLLRIVGGKKSLKDTHCSVKVSGVDSSMHPGTQDNTNPYLLLCTLPGCLLWWPQEESRVRSKPAAEPGLGRKGRPLVHFVGMRVCERTHTNNSSGICTQLELLDCDSIQKEKTPANMYLKNKWSRLEDPACSGVAHEPGGPIWQRQGQQHTQYPDAAKGTCRWCNQWQIRNRTSIRERKETETGVCKPTRQAKHVWKGLVQIKPAGEQVDVHLLKPHQQEGSPVKHLEAASRRLDGVWLPHESAGATGSRPQSPNLEITAAQTRLEPPQAHSSRTLQRLAVDTGCWYHMHSSVSQKGHFEKTILVCSWCHFDT